MKLLITILSVLIGVGLNAQISTIAVNTSSDFTLRTTLSTTTTLNAGLPTVYFVGSQSTSTPDIPTMTTTGYTWIQLATVTYNNNASRFIRLTAFVCYPTASVVGATTTITWGSSQTWTGWIQYRVSAGSNVKVFQSATNSATSTNPNITLGSLQGNNNAVFAAFLNDKNPFGGTAEASWTEDFDAGAGTAGTNAVGRYGTSRTNHSDNTVQVTAASSNWAGIALELRAFRWVYIQ